MSRRHSGWRRDHNMAVARSRSTLNRLAAVADAAELAEAVCSRCARPYFTEPDDNGECCICTARLRTLTALAALTGGRLEESAQRHPARRPLIAPDGSPRSVTCTASDADPAHLCRRRDGRALYGPGEDCFTQARGEVLGLLGVEE